LALRLGVERIVDGWLSTYAAGTARRKDLAAAYPDAVLDLDPAYGIGTTEYMRSVGGRAVTLECGQHDDPCAVEVAHRAIVNTLAHLGLIDAADPAPAARVEALSLCEVVDKTSAADGFARPWQGFDRVAAGERIGTRADGSVIEAPFDGFIVFPNPNALAGQEWFYLARESTRFARKHGAGSATARAGAS
jgi:predicted deacylase